MAVLHQAHPTRSTNTPAGRHDCGCKGTNDTLPKLVSFFRHHGHLEISYSASINIPKDLGLKSSCRRCQLKTEGGVETAINAIHCGPDSLIEQRFMKTMFISLIELRLQQDNPNLPELHNEKDVPYDAKRAAPTSPISNAPPTSRPAPQDWDWDNIWHEFAKAFELRRDRVNVAELLRDLSELKDLKYQDWWKSVLRRLGGEAFLTLEGYVGAGLVMPPKSTEMSAWRRDAGIIQSVDDLFDLYVNIDSQVYGYVHAHKMLRVKCLCCCGSRPK
ncbi:hypothetical protein F5Y12DRAFT_738472 [Xylaria sp. FL1777]|nr:hypothetical protein F5Y12DRAFT_738472 [Xylaria sp. FL1777]